MTPHPTKQEPKEQERTLAATLREIRRIRFRTCKVPQCKTEAHYSHDINSPLLDEIIAALDSTSTSKDETVAELAALLPEVDKISDRLVEKVEWSKNHRMSAALYEDTQMLLAKLGGLLSSLPHEEAAPT